MVNLITLYSSIVVAGCLMFKVVVRDIVHALASRTSSSCCWLWIRLTMFPTETLKSVEWSGFLFRFLDESVGVYASMETAHG